MIKINLVREGRAVRGTGQVPVVASVTMPVAQAPTNVNNIIVDAVPA